MLSRYNLVNKSTLGAGQTRVSNADNLIAPTTIALAIDKLWAVPILLPAGRLSSIGFEVTGAGGAGCKARACLLAADPKPGRVYPNKFIVGSESSEADATATGLKETTITVDIDEGLYFVCLVNGGGTLATFRGVPLAGLPQLLGFNSTPVGITMHSKAATYSSTGFSAMLTSSSTEGLIFPTASPTAEVGIAPLVWVQYSK